LNLKNKFDYIGVLKTPVIAIIILSIIALLTSVLIFNNVKTEEEFNANKTNASLVSIIIVLISICIYFYSGYIAVKKHDGTIKNSAIVGVIISLVQSILSILNIFIMYYLIEIYRLNINSIINDPFIKSLLIVGILLGVIFTVCISAGISSLGGYIARKKK
jgi:hypothetical protein